MPWECKTVNKLREEFVAKVMLKELDLPTIRYQPNNRIQMGGKILGWRNNAG